MYVGRLPLAIAIFDICSSFARHHISSMTYVGVNLFWKKKRDAGEELRHKPTTLLQVEN